MQALAQFFLAIVAAELPVSLSSTALCELCYIYQCAASTQNTLREEPTWLERNRIRAETVFKTVLDFLQERSSA